MAVVETARFLKDTKALLLDSEREELVAYLGTNPQAGELVPGTGGVRKIRWAVEGHGKRGGARVIYYYHSAQLPLFLLTAYGKNEKGNLTMAERNTLKRLIPLLVSSYPAQQRRPQ